MNQIISNRNPLLLLLTHIIIKLIGMGLTTAQKNKRKRERKKRERAAERLEQEQQAAKKKAKTGFEVSESEAVKHNNENVEIEYVAEPLFPSSNAVADNKEGAAADSSNAPSANGANNADDEDEDDGQDINAVMRRFQNRAAVIYVTDEDNTNNNATDSTKNNDDNLQDDENGDENNDNLTSLSKRKLKDKLRPTVAQLKQTVRHPELVEAHDVTAPDPQFLVYLKGIPGTVPVPRHWGRKRKYLQGKRGVEKPPFALPDFIIKTGICDVRDATAEDESKMSVKQKNRLRVSGRGGGVDVDYRTLYEAFFQHQTKPDKLTTFGDLYYEGKEYETIKSSNFRPGYMSEKFTLS